MPKLHEKLAVKSGVIGKLSKLVSDLVATFSNKHHLFGNKSSVYTPDREGSSPIVEEQGVLQSTVPKELAWISASFIETVNLNTAINNTNTVAKADVIIDGVTVLKDQVSLNLLELKKTLLQYKSVLVAAPTLDPAKGFALDKDAGENVYRAREVVRRRTAKVKTVLTLATATDKHPAQVQVYDKDEEVGTLRTNEWSGMITPARKSELLDKAEKWINAVEEAISRANNVDVVQGDKIGQTVFASLLE